MKIYTKQGDQGTTTLLGGPRVSKANVRVEAYGTVDELNATLGWARGAGLSEALDAELGRTQESCFRLGAWLATAAGADPQVARIGEEDVSSLERAIDGMEERLPPLKNFVLPGGSEAGARLHVARTVARRAERAVVTLGTVEDVQPDMVRWLNRLSDFLFVAARLANREAGAEEVVWKPRAR
jgi:cob(I)alamin adenosyltransferase